MTEEKLQENAEGKQRENAEGKPLLVTTREEQLLDAFGLFFLVVIFVALMTGVGWKLSGGAIWGSYIGGGLGFGIAMLSKSVRKLIFGIAFLALSLSIVVSVAVWIFI